MAASGVAADPGSAASPPESVPLTIVVFSKVYQELRLGFDESAATTAEAGLQGVDPPIRPGGEIEPERAAEELPSYAEALRKRGLQLPLLTTAITSAASPQAESILRSAKALGVQSYRIGFIERHAGASLSGQINDVKAQLKDLAALNRQIGIGAVFQNHSPSGHAYLGGDLAELREIVSGFDPTEIGVAFDIGHALIVHQDGWRAHFEALKSHLRVAYVKDVNAQGQWVPFGQGELGRIDYFKMLKRLGYRAPLSLHVEFDWSGHGKSMNRQTLILALQRSANTLRGWLA